MEQEFYSDAELAEAAKEDSPRYNAIVLHQAIEIVKRQVRLKTVGLAASMNLTRSALFRVQSKQFIPRLQFERFLALLEHTREKEFIKMAGV